MSRRWRLLRFLAGLALVLALLLVSFALIVSLVHTWGTSHQDRAPREQTAV